MNKFFERDIVFSGDYNFPDEIYTISTKEYIEGFNIDKAIRELKEIKKHYKKWVKQNGTDGEWQVRK